MKSAPLTSKERIINIEILVLFLFTTLSGVLRKWLFESDTVKNIIFGIQLIIPFLFLYRNKILFSRHPISAANYLYLVILLLMAFNPLNLTIYHGVFGFISHYAFWFMFFFYFINRDIFRIEKVVMVFIIVCALEIILAFLQYSLPADHFLNAYARPEANTSGIIAMAGDSVRITGTFSFIGGFGSLIVFWGFLIWYLRTREYSFLLIVSLVIFGSLLALMSGSRGTAVIFFALVFFAFFSEISISTFIKNTTRIIASLIVLSIFIFLMSDPFNIYSRLEKSYTNFMMRVDPNIETGEAERRTLWGIYGIERLVGHENTFFGVGLGATYQGATAIWGTSPKLKSFGYLEYEPERIIAEGGFVLLLFRFFLFIILLRYSVMPKIPLLIIIILVNFSNFLIVFNIFSQVYLFLGIALVDRAYYLKKYQRASDNFIENIEDPQKR